MTLEVNIYKKVKVAHRMIKNNCHYQILRYFLTLGVMFSLDNSPRSPGKSGSVIAIVTPRRKSAHALLPV